MEDWISDLLIFCAGIAGGVLIASTKPYLSAAKTRRTQLVAARARMLAELKEKHDEEILDQAFRTTEAIRGELDKSLDTLRKTLNTVLPLNGAPETHQERPVIQLAEPAKPN
ncbi:MAG: hypothetical protein HW373_714 [Deltaproteobacteria bacterium]|nr:hypothetical protein [Deltaproteobacteria bacterium]